MKKGQDKTVRYWKLKGWKLVKKKTGTQKKIKWKKDEK